MADFAVLLLLNVVVSITKPSGDANKVLLDLAKYPNARCLDGSPGAFYLSQPQTPTPHRSGWYLFQQGGGFCTSLQDCEKRSKTDLGSSLATHWPATLDLDKYDPFMGFDRNVTRNPLLGNFASIFIVYCDGAYFSGSNSTVTTMPSGRDLHFRGREIFEATVSTLVADYGLGGGGTAEQSEVILGGCSAGGIATFAHADWAGGVLETAGALPHGNSRYSAFPISGYYLDVDFFTAQKRFPYEQSNCTATLSQECVRDQNALSPPTPWKCIVASVNAKYVRTPTYLFQSKYDADQLGTSFNPPCTNAKCADP